MQSNINKADIHTEAVAIHNYKGAVAKETLASVGVWNYLMHRDPSFLSTHTTVASTELTC